MWQNGEVAAENVVERGATTQPLVPAPGREKSPSTIGVRYGRNTFKRPVMTITTIANI